MFKGADSEVLKWVTDVLGPGAEVAAKASLHGDVSPWLLNIKRDGEAFNVVLRIPVEGRISPGGILTNVAALAWTARYGLPTPRLIACDRTGEQASVVTSLETALPGVSEFPDNLNEEQLQRAGAAIARVNSIHMHPKSHLLKRTRPIQPDDYARDRRWSAHLKTHSDQEEEIIRAYSSATGWPANVARSLLANVSSTPLLQVADEYVRAHGLPSEPAVFVHGDLWPGNTRWLDGVFAALIDWKTAGVGSAGVDLGSMRMQVALRYGIDAAEIVREGWEQQTGREAGCIPYWDAVAALNTPTVMEGWPGCESESHPLGSIAVTARRDLFLSRAIGQLEVHRKHEREVTGWI